MSIQETVLKIKGTTRYILEGFLISLGCLGILGIAYGLTRTNVERAQKPLENKALVRDSLDQPASVAPITLDISNDNLNQVSEPAKDVQKPKSAAGKPDSAIAAGAFAASKSGKVYYPSDCKALSRVKPANRIYFQTEADAKSKGLTKSKSCQ